MLGRALCTGHDRRYGWISQVLQPQSSRTNQPALHQIDGGCAIENKKATPRSVEWPFKLAVADRPLAAARNTGESSQPQTAGENLRESSAADCLVISNARKMEWNSGRNLAIKNRPPIIFIFGNRQRLRRALG
jgi:hypothetical protein